MILYTITVVVFARAKKNGVFFFIIEYSPSVIQYPLEQTYTLQTCNRDSDQTDKTQRVGNSKRLCRRDTISM